ncbi:MAG: chemotaxis protein CheW [Planctomycetes bacterium]|nr:chemotaxis protein CheW [Planctomycetota bacterium]
MSEAGALEDESSPAEVAGSLLVFRAGGTTLGIETSFVERLVADDLPRTAVPGAPAHILGVINHRGAAIAVLDLLTFLALPPADDPTRRLVVVRAAGMGAAIPVQAIGGIERVEFDFARLEDAGALDHTRGLLDLESGPVYVLDLPQLLQAAAARPS